MLATSNYHIATGQRKGGSDRNRGNVRGTSYFEKGGLLIEIRQVGIVGEWEETKELSIYFFKICSFNYYIPSVV